MTDGEMTDNGQWQIVGYIQIYTDNGKWQIVGMTDNGRNKDNGKWQTMGHNNGK